MYSLTGGRNKTWVYDGRNSKLKLFNRTCPGRIIPSLSVLKDYNYVVQIFISHFYILNFSHYRGP